MTDQAKSWLPNPDQTPAAQLSSGQPPPPGQRWSSFKRNPKNFQRDRTDLSIQARRAGKGLLIVDWQL